MFFDVVIVAVAVVIVVHDVLFMCGLCVLKSFERLVCCSLVAYQSQGHDGSSPACRGRPILSDAPFFFDGTVQGL